MIIAFTFLIVCLIQAALNFLFFSIDDIIQKSDEDE